VIRSLILIACLSVATRAAGEPSNRVIAFYYGWYANPQTDGAYDHWNSAVFQRDKNAEPTNFPGGDDIGSNFYPQAGCYSVNDSETLARQMRELVEARVGVICASWWGEDSFTGKNLPKLMDAAQAHGLHVCIHIEPFPGRNAQTTGQAIRTLIDKYGSHPAFFRSREAGNRPVFFVYDSYLTAEKDWADLLAPTGKETIRNSKYDSVVIGLWVKENDGKFMRDAHFDGFYTYFASDGFVYGSTTKNWPTLAKFARENKLLFIPSVGPGYIDTRIRPWNTGTTRSRDSGRYYDKMFEAAINCAPRFITITSYNEWHEGTQIEPAMPKKIEGHTYDSYQPLSPDHYLKRTARWVEEFHRRSR
jgi:glycoprotein endo-alpha-1,2-mannosidase